MGSDCAGQDGKRIRRKGVKGKKELADLAPKHECGIDVATPKWSVPVSQSPVGATRRQPCPLELSEVARFARCLQSRLSRWCALLCCPPVLVVRCVRACVPACPACLVPASSCTRSAPSNRPRCASHARCCCSGLPLAAAHARPRPTRPSPQGRQ